MPRTKTPKATFAMSWIDALKQWNAGKTAWCNPRKGTAEYNQVLKIRQGSEPAEPVPEPVPEPEKQKMPEEPKIIVKSAKEIARERAEAKKTIIDDLKAMIIPDKRSESFVINMDYSASGFLLDAAILNILNKYKEACAVLPSGTKVRVKYGNALEDFNPVLIGFYLKNCIDSGAKIIAIPLALQFSSGSGHQNMLIYKVNTNTLEHFEPHGSKFRGRKPKETEDFDKFGNEVLSKWESLGIIPPGAKFIPSDELCPIGISFQGSDGEDKQTYIKEGIQIKTKGFCQMWSLFYLEMVLKFPDVESTQLIKTMYSEIKALSKTTPKAFFKHIANYSQDITEDIVNFIKSKGNKLINPNLFQRMLNKGLGDTIIKTINTATLEYSTRYTPEIIKAGKELLDKLEDMHKKAEMELETYSNELNNRKPKRKLTKEEKNKQQKLWYAAALINRDIVSVTNDLRAREAAVKKTQAE